MWYWLVYDGHHVLGRHIADARESLGNPEHLEGQLLARNQATSGGEAASPTRAQTFRLLSSVWTMVAVALIIRLVVMRFFSPNLLDPARDHYLPGMEGGHYIFPREYERIARSILTGGGFSDPFPLPTGPTAMVGPVYAYVLACVFRLFGIFTPASTMAALALNNIMASLTCLPVFAIAKRQFGPRIAVWAGWAWVVYPHSIAGPNAWIWETVLGTLLLTLLLLYTLKLEDSTNYLAWVGYGLLWAIAALTSANDLSVLPFLGGWIFFRQWHSGKLRLGPILASSLVFFLGVTPWIWRCSKVYGRFVAFRGNFGLEVMVGNSDDTSRPSNWDETPGSNLAQLKEVQRLGEPAYMAAKEVAAVHVIKDRPVWYAGQTLRRVLYTWTNIWEFPPPWNFSESGLPDILYYSAISLLAFIGAGWAIRFHWQKAVPLLFPLIFFPIIYYLTHQEDGRYRHPIDPVVVILATCGACSLYSKFTAGTGPEMAEEQSH